MSETKVVATGGCLCGAVRYTANDEAMRVINCHCKSCRKHTGAPAATLAVYGVDQIMFSGDERKVYASSPNVGRAFCSECGTTLTFETELRGYGPICAIHVSTFDNPHVVIPTAHSFYSERLSWFDIADDLPRYAGFVKDNSLMQHGPAKT